MSGSRRYHWKKRKQFFIPDTWQSDELHSPSKSAHTATASTEIPVEETSQSTSQQNVNATYAPFEGYEQLITHRGIDDVTVETSSNVSAGKIVHRNTKE